MSVRIAEITGLREREFFERENSMTPVYENIKLLLTSFYGGVKRGPCVQLTLEDNYIQLTKEQCYELSELLTKIE